MYFKTKSSLKQRGSIAIVFAIIFLLIDFQDNILFNYLVVWVSWVFCMMFIELLSLFLIRNIKVSEESIVFSYSKLLFFIKPIEFKFSNIKSLDIRASKPPTIKIEYFGINNKISKRLLYFGFIGTKDIKKIISFVKDNDIIVSSIGYE